MSLNKFQKEELEKQKRYKLIKEGFSLGSSEDLPEAKIKTRHVEMDQANVKIKKDKVILDGSGPDENLKVVIYSQALAQLVAKVEKALQKGAYDDLMGTWYDDLKQESHLSEVGRPRL